MIRREGKMLIKRVLILFVLTMGAVMASAQSVQYFIRNKKNNASVLVLYPNQTYAYFIQKPQGYKKDSGTYTCSKRHQALKLQSDAVIGCAHDLSGLNCYLQGQSIADDMGTVLLKTLPSNDSLLKTLRQTKAKSNTGKYTLPTTQITLVQNNNFTVQLLPSNDSWYNKVQYYDPVYVKKANAQADTMYRQELDNRREYNTITPGKIKIYQLAKSLTQNFNSDSLKVMALANWIVRNFHYDLNGPVDPESLLTAKATRCQGYADFMTEMCLGINLPCLTINGYADNFLGNRVYDQVKTNHAWNIVKVKGQWRLLDVTWLDPVGGVGNSVNGQSDYFLSQPLDFLFDHMPHDPAFKFTNLREASILDYVNSPIRVQRSQQLQYLGPKSIVHYLSDSIMTFYVYSKKPISLKCEFNDSDAWYNPTDIPLGMGVNKVTVKVPKHCRQLYFTHPELAFRFKLFADNQSSQLFREALIEDNSPYTKQFYQFIQKQLSAATLTIDKTLPAEFQNKDLWLPVLKQYKGRLPATNLYSYSETKFNSKNKPVYTDVTEYQFFMNGLSIQGQAVYVKAIVKCPFDKYLKSTSEQCPLSQMVLSLKDPTDW